MANKPTCSTHNNPPWWVLGAISVGVPAITANLLPAESLKLMVTIIRFPPVFVALIITTLVMWAEYDRWKNRNACASA